MRNTIITGVCVALSLAAAPAWAQIAVSSNDHKVKQENGVTSNADNLDVGLTGCRRTLPDMHRVLDHLEDTLTALEENC